MTTTRNGSIFLSKKNSAEDSDFYEPNNSFVEIITNETYDFTVSGLKMATMGIAFSAGGGGNLPACIAAICIAGLGGALVGLISGTYHAMNASEQSDLPKKTYANNTIPGRTAENRSSFFNRNRDDSHLSKNEQQQLHGDNRLTCSH